MPSRRGVLRRGRWDSGALLARLDDLREVIAAGLPSPGVWPAPALGWAGAGLGSAGLAASTETPDRPAAGPDFGTPVPGVAGGGARRPAEDPADYPEDPDSPEQVRHLLSRAQGGDPEAFGQLYDRYVQLVYRYLYFRVGNQALAEDLTSETFTRALRRISTFSWQGRDFGAWLVTIARNLVADHYKSARFRLEVPTADLLGAGADRPAAGPEGQVLDSLTNAALLDAVRQLGAEQQECVVLRFLEGLSVHETALAMGKKPGAIKALQYRAVRSLGQILPAGLAP